MALLNEVDLKLNITAVDKATQVLQGLQDMMTSLQDTIAEMSKSTLNPFRGIITGAEEATSAIQDIVDRLDEINEFKFDTALFDPLVGQFQSAMIDIEDSVGETTKMITGEFDSLKIKDPFATMMTSVAKVEDSFGNMHDMLVEISDMKVQNPLIELQTSAQETLDTLQRIVDTEDMIHPVDATVGATGAGAAGMTAEEAGMIGASSHGNGFLKAGMNGLMAYYALQQLTSSANNMLAISQIQGLDHGTVNEAAQSYALLGAGGMSGMAAPQFLSQLSGTLRQLFNPTSNNYSTNEKYLSSLGIGPSYATASPMMALQGIAGRYQSLMGQGNTSAASQLLSLTGTSSLQGLFTNWSSAQKATSGINLDMTTAQLKRAGQQDVSMQMNLQKLSIAFSELAVELIPVIDPLVTGFTSLLHVVNPLVAALSPAAGNAISQPGGVNLTNPVPGPAELQSITQELNRLGVFKFFNDLAKGEMQAQAKLNEWGANLAKWASGLYSHFANGVKAWPGDILRFAQSLPERFMVGIKDFGNQVLRWSQGLVNFFTTGVPDFAEGVRSWASRLIDSFTAGIGSFETGVRDWFAQLWSTIERTATLAVMQTGTSALGAVHSTPIIGGMATSAYAESQFSTDLYGHGFNRGNLNVSGKASAGHVITINISGGTLQERQNAKMVADSIVQNLKIQGNFDFSY